MRHHFCGKYCVFCRYFCKATFVSNQSCWPNLGAFCNKKPKRARLALARHTILQFFHRPVPWELNPLHHFMELGFFPAKKRKFLGQPWSYFTQFLLQEQAQSVAFSQDGAVILVGCVNGKWMIFDTQTRELLGKSCSKPASKARSWWYGNLTHRPAHGRQRTHSGDQFFSGWKNGGVGFQRQPHLHLPGVWGWHEVQQSGEMFRTFQLYHPRGLGWR